MLITNPYSRRLSALHGLGRPDEISLFALVKNNWWRITFPKKEKEKRKYFFERLQVILKNMHLEDEKSLESPGLLVVTQVEAEAELQEIPV